MLFFVSYRILKGGVKQVVVVNHRSLGHALGTQGLVKSVYQLRLAIVERDLISEVRLDLSVYFVAIALQGGLLNLIPMHVLEPIVEKFHEGIVLGIVIALSQSHFLGFERTQELAPSFLNHRLLLSLVKPHTFPLGLGDLFDGIVVRIDEVELAILFLHAPRQHKAVFLCH